VVWQKVGTDPGYTTQKNSKIRFYVELPGCEVQANDGESRFYEYKHGINMG